MVGENKLFQSQLCASIDCLVNIAILLSKTFFHVGSFSRALKIFQLQRIFLLCDLTNLSGFQDETERVFRHENSNFLWPFSLSCSNNFLILRNEIRLLGKIRSVEKLCKGKANGMRRKDSLPAIAQNEM